MKKTHQKKKHQRLLVTGTCLPINRCKYVLLKKSSLFEMIFLLTSDRLWPQAEKQHVELESLILPVFHRVAATYSHTVIHTLVHNYLKPNWQQIKHSATFTFCPMYTQEPSLRASVSLTCPFSSSLGIQGSFCEIFLQDRGQDIESV